MDAVSVRADRPMVGSAELRAFRQMSSLLDKKARSGFLMEMLVFAVVIGLVAWPLISLGILMSQTAHGY